jgi:hypothetical protein
MASNLPLAGESMIRCAMSFTTAPLIRQGR